MKNTMDESVRSYGPLVAADQYQNALNELIGSKELSLPLSQLGIEGFAKGSEVRLGLSTFQTLDAKESQEKWHGHKEIYMLGGRAIHLGNTWGDYIIDPRTDQPISPSLSQISSLTDDRLIYSYSAYEMTALGRNPFDDDAFYAGETDATLADYPAFYYAPLLLVQKRSPLASNLSENFLEKKVTIHEAANLKKASVHNSGSQGDKKIKAYLDDDYEHEERRRRIAEEWEARYALPPRERMQKFAGETFKSTHNSLVTYALHDTAMQQQILSSPQTLAFPELEVGGVTNQVTARLDNGRLNSIRFTEGTLNHHRGFFLTQAENGKIVIINDSLSSTWTSNDARFPGKIEAAADYLEKYRNILDNEHYPSLYQTPDAMKKQFIRTDKLVPRVAKKLHEI
jgi:hypothetical protein